MNTRSHVTSERVCPVKKTWPIEIDCPNCAAKLERALAEVPGVTRVSVNYVQKRLTLEAADDAFQAVTDAVLAKAAEIEPDTVIHVGQEKHHHHDACRDDHCGCQHAHEHAHPHEQIGYVIEGSIVYHEEGKEAVTLHAGDSYLVAPNIRHGIDCLTKVKLMDIFTPMREDFV